MSPPVLGSLMGLAICGILHWDCVRLTSATSLTSPLLLQMEKEAEARKRADEGYESPLDDVDSQSSKSAPTLTLNDLWEKWGLRTVRLDKVGDGLSAVYRKVRNTGHPACWHCERLFPDRRIVYEWKAGEDVHLLHEACVVIKGQQSERGKEATLERVRELLMKTSYDRFLNSLFAIEDDLYANGRLFMTRLDEVPNLEPLESEPESWEAIVTPTKRSLKRQKVVGVNPQSEPKALAGDSA